MTDTHVRALGSLLHDIAATALRTADELVANANEVKVCGDWFRFGGLDSKGRMILWAEGYSDPFVYGPTFGSDDDPERFPWRECAWTDPEVAEDLDAIRSGVPGLSAPESGF